MTDTLLVPGRIVVVQWLKIRLQPHTTDDTALIRTLPGKTGKVDGCVKICGRAGIFAIPVAEVPVGQVEVAGRRLIGVACFAAFGEEMIEPVAVLPV